MVPFTYNPQAADTGYTVIFAVPEGVLCRETFGTHSTHEDASLAADKLNADPARSFHFRPGGAARVANILVNALRRTYDREIAAELQAQGLTTVIPETEARVWAKIEAEMNEKNAESDRVWARTVAKQNERNARKTTRK